MSAKSDLTTFIIDNSDPRTKVMHCVADWCGVAAGLDIATGHFEIGALLALQDHWPMEDEERKAARQSQGRLFPEE